MSEPHIFYFGFFSGLLIGAFSSIVTHTLTKRRDLVTRNAILDRESELRRREFLRLVVRGCCSIRRPATPDHSPEDPWITYNIAITEISAEFAMCEGDFQDAAKVLSALQVAVALEKDQVDAKVRKSGGDHRSVLTGFLAAISEAAIDK
jgi:hypothetical protein